MIDSLHLENGSRVAVLGCGPAGSFFTIFLRDMAERSGLDLRIDVYEARDFSKPAPIGCNMCGGIVSESLVQSLALEGINLPSTVVQRGIDSYVLHTDMGSARIEPPREEKRIGAVYRGSGPRDVKESRWVSFDGHLQGLAVERGARLVPERVQTVDWEDGRPRLTTRSGTGGTYDLLGVAVGVNSPTLRMFEQFEFSFVAPSTTKTFIHEYKLGEETIDRLLGTSMHVFLLDIPRLEFGAVVPKGEYASVCLLGEDIDKELVASFLATPEVRRLFPGDWEPGLNSCHCAPRINVGGSPRPYADRLLFLGDAGVTRLYKDGIGSAYRTAKAGATTALFGGIAAEDFARDYAPVLREIERDNDIGRRLFDVSRRIQHSRAGRKAIVRQVHAEGSRPPGQRHLSGILWDMFTGSATYGDILRRGFHPRFLTNLSWCLATSLVRPGNRTEGRAA